MKPKWLNPINPIPILTPKIPQNSVQTLTFPKDMNPNGLRVKERAKRKGLEKQKGNARHPFEIWAMLQNPCEAPRNHKIHPNPTNFLVGKKRWPVPGMEPLPGLTLHHRSSGQFNTAPQPAKEIPLPGLVCFAGGLSGHVFAPRLCDHCPACGEEGDAEHDGGGGGDCGRNHVTVDLEG
ncbi:hypothetical protein Droror1_Dr00018619 [Drosera rotundifolia]